MSTTQRGIAELVRESGVAVRAALGRSHLARAWELLQDRADDSRSRGTLPYTEEAIGELEAAHRHDPEDVNAVHHLAIAHHARAWDFELRGDPRAIAEWETALAFWRSVAASGAFWSQLEDKLLRIDPQADRRPLGELRRGLLEQMLEVHVGFVRHYSEAGTPDRATGHVRLVQRASIPPAVKKRLVAKVFVAMTGGVAEAKATRDFAAALIPVERFLSLFPDYLQALRLHAEVCKEWVSGMSFRDDWKDILDVSVRALPHAERLAAHGELASEPLARTALEELAFAVALRGHDLGVTYFVKQEGGDEDALGREEAREAFELAIRWGRVAAPVSGESATIRELFSYCAIGFAFALRDEIGEVLSSDADGLTRLQAAIRLCQLAIDEMEEARRWHAGNKDLEGKYSEFRELLGRLQGEKEKIALYRRMEGWQ